MVEQDTEGSVVLSWKKKYKGKNGQKEVDLLVKKGMTLYAVECKAFSKSRRYWFGEPAATTSRISKVAKAVIQAKESAKAVSNFLNTSRSNFPDISAVEWVVCSPTQEYIKPPDKYGYLSEKIPRVCTPQEFINHLNSS